MTVWAVLAAVGLCALVIAVSAGTIRSRQSQEMSRIAAREPQARSWLAIAENATHTSVFTVDRMSLSLRTRRGVVERAWPLAELRDVTDTRVKIGLLSRPGLRLEFNGDPTLNALSVGFPIGGGLTISAAKAAEVKAAIVSAQQGQGPFEPN
jgi:hypothetical protein